MIYKKSKNLRFCKNSKKLCDDFENNRNFKHLINSWKCFSVFKARKKNPYRRSSSWIR